MPSTCNQDGCNCAVRIADDNGVTDPNKARVETYECPRGHRFTVTLEAL